LLDFFWLASNLEKSEDSARGKRSKNLKVDEMNKKYSVLLSLSFVIIILLILRSSNLLLDKTTKKLPVQLPQLTLRGYTLIENQADGPNFLYSIVTDSDYIYLAGSCFNCGLKKNLAWQIEKRRKGDGQLDSKFGKNGKIIIDPTDYDDEAYAITVDSSFIYIAGIQGGESGNANWRIEKRDKVTGAYDKNFGEGGYIISNPVNEDNEAYSIAADDSFIYIAGLEGGTGADGNGFWRIEKRDKITGAYDKNFGEGGYIISHPTTNNDLARSLYVDKDFIYIGGHQNGSDLPHQGDWAWRIEKRNKINGDYDKKFGEGGSIVINPSEGDDFIYSIITDSSFVYFVGYQKGNRGNGNFWWRIEKREKFYGQF
jgi:hypothetical protein